MAGVDTTAESPMEEEFMQVYAQNVSRYNTDFMYRYPCKGCGDILEEGKAFELAGNRWHIDCFRCNTCGTLLDSDANLLLLGDGSLICNNCTYSCNACGNKIEDLAILTGDQAFCSSCFRCRNCKKKIENLRYARTSQGIFCMSCHETLMARRRKRTKATPKPGSNGARTTREKALPSLPPGAAPETAFTPDVETPPLEVPSGTPARSPPERPYQERMQPPSTSANRGLSPLSDDARRDGPTLPASTYGEPRPSTASLNSDDGDERGFLPMAFDPTPVEGPSPNAVNEATQSQNFSPPARNESRIRDYFGGPLSPNSAMRDERSAEQRTVSSRSVSAEREPERSTSQAKASPHILFQEKGRSKKASENSTPLSTSATASPATATFDRSRQQQADGGSLSSNQNETFRLQEAPKSKKTASGRSSKTEAKSPDKHLTQSPASTSSSVNPFEDPKLGDRPVRGDSLASAAQRMKTPTMDSQASTGAQSQIAPQRQASVSSVPGSFVDAKSTISRDNSRSKPLASPALRSSLEAPPPRASSRPNANNKAIVEDFTAPRAPPLPPPTTDMRHQRNESLNSALYGNEANDPSIRSASLPKHSMEAPFSMEEELARIMRGDSVKQKQAPDSPQSSVLRKVSNAVKHGRSFSDRGLGSAGIPKHSSNGGIELGTPLTISSPILASPTGKDSPDQLAAQLRRAQQRIGELEGEVNRLEEKVNSSAEIKAANNELREKRTTMVVLDTQREMVVRELEVMTDHLTKAKNNNEPLDLSTLKSDVMKDFAESLQKLKDQMSAQIEDLMHKRNELTEEIGNLIQMKDKGFQEYESLSNKNAQLLEMNNQILHNIQDMYKSNRGANGTAPSANGLGIYHPGSKLDTPGPSEVRNLNLVNTDPSMPNLLQENEAESATLLNAPQVVNIRKGQPKKFNWRKGGEKMAKNVTKGLKGAFAGDRPTPGSAGEGPYSIGLPYNQTVQAVGPSSDQTSLNGSKQALDPNRSGSAFGFFSSQKAGGLKAGPGGNMKDNSSTNLSIDASVLFGSELEARCEFEKRVVPAIVSRCIEEVELRGMDMEGIYRKSGGSGQVKIVQQGFEKDGNYDISDPDLDIHAVTSALKQYFRKLPTPLITYDVYDLFLEAGRVQDKEKQVSALRIAVDELPEHHRDCLEFLIQHLARVMAQESKNLMTPLNLSVVFAPTIMRPLTIEREMSDMQAQRMAVQALLDQHEAVFPDE